MLEKKIDGQKGQSRLKMPAELVVRQSSLSKKLRNKGVITRKYKTVL